MATERGEEAYKVPWQLGEKPCTVYFFKRWAGYSHPVRPVEPLTHEDALNLAGYCRVFLCGEGKMSRITFFQAIKTERAEVALATPPAPAAPSARYFALTRAKDELGLGKEVSAAEATMLDELIRIPPRNEVQPPGNRARIEIVTHSVGYSYEYKYDDAGVLKQVVITNPEGRSVLDY
jgi:hypothetical protein